MDMQPTPDKDNNETEHSADDGRITKWTFVKDYIIIFIFAVLVTVVCGIYGMVRFFSLVSLEHRCNYNATATVTSVKVYYDKDDNKDHSTAQFIYTYKGRDYQPSNETYNVSYKIAKGHQFTIQINPDNPSEYYYPAGKQSSYQIALWAALFGLLVAAGIILKSILSYKHHQQIMHYVDPSLGLNYRTGQHFDPSATPKAYAALDQKANLEAAEKVEQQLDDTLDSLEQMQQKNRH